MANATTYLATPGFQIGPNLAGVKNLTDQCRSVVVTKSREALDSTSFGNTGRQFVGGLTNVTVTATLLMEYSSTPGTYIDLTSLVGTNVYVAVKADANSAISTTNPEMQVTGGYLESLDVVNGSVGELSEVEITITGGVLVEDVTP